MNARSILFGAALVVVTATITTQVVSQNTKDKPKAPTAVSAPPAGMPEMTPDEKQVMEACSTLGMPGENHKVLNNHVGKWNCTMKWWMTPESKAMDSTFTADTKWIYDGRYLSETVEGQMMPGQTFLGQSYMGYDNAEKKYFSTWMDNMGTGMMVSKGDFDATQKSFAFSSKMFCPLAKKEVNCHMTQKWIDNDHFTMEMHGPWYKTGKDYKMMEIAYARAK